MLLYPSINTLNEKTDSRYSLCILAAKRARDIVDGKPALTEEECERPVSQAAKEVADDMITYRRPVHEEPAAETPAEEAEGEAAETEETAAEPAEESAAAEEAVEAEEAPAEETVEAPAEEESAEEK